MSAVNGRRTTKTARLRSSSAGRVGGDPPKISFLTFGAKMGSSVGVKTHQIKKGSHDLFLMWCTLVEMFRTKYYQAIVEIAKEIKLSQQYLGITTIA